MSTFQDFVVSSETAGTANLTDEQIRELARDRLQEQPPQMLDPGIQQMLTGFTFELYNDILLRGLDVRDEDWDYDTEEEFQNALRGICERSLGVAVVAASVFSERVIGIAIKPRPSARTQQTTVNTNVNMTDVISVEDTVSSTVVMPAEAATEVHVGIQ